MHALFIATPPQDILVDHRAARRWEAFLGTAETFLEKHGGTRFNQGTMLFDLSTGMRPLTTVCSAAEEWDLETRVVFFDDAPTFVVTPSKHGQ